MFDNSCFFTTFFWKIQKMSFTNKQFYFQRTPTKLNILERNVVIKIRREWGKLEV